MTREREREAEGGVTLNNLSFGGPSLNAIPGGDATVETCLGHGRVSQIWPF